MAGWMAGLTALSPAGDRIALGGAALTVIDIQSRTIREVDRPYWGAWGVSWSPNGKYITARIHARISLFDARSGTLLDQLSGVDGDVVWSPDSHQLVAPAPSDGTAIVWSIQEGGTASETQTLLGGEMNGPIEGLAFSHDGNAVMAGDERTAVKIWNLEPRNAEWATFPNRRRLLVGRRVHAGRASGGDERIRQGGLREDLGCRVRAPRADARTRRASGSSEGDLVRREPQRRAGRHHVGQPDAGMEGGDRRGGPPHAPRRRGLRAAGAPTETWSSLGNRRVRADHRSFGEVVETLSTDGTKKCTTRGSVRMAASWPRRGTLRKRWSGTGIEAR